MDETSVIAKVLDWAWVSIIGLLVFCWKGLAMKIDGKADKDFTNHRLDTMMDALNGHIEEDRDVHKEISQKLDETNNHLHELIGAVRESRR